MISRAAAFVLIGLIALLPAMSLMARDGDTLLPVEVSAPGLKTNPESMLGNNFEVIVQRVEEARTSGVPLAVRVVDLNQDSSQIPMPVRQLAGNDFATPLSDSQKDIILESWIDQEPIETTQGANDGFMLLILVPKDQTQAQVLWWIGPNALPINGLTAANIAGTQQVMQEQFDAGNVPNGIFLGILEFSYLIQFGESARIERTTLQDALHTAVLPLSIGTALAGLAVPGVSIWLSRRRQPGMVGNPNISPWEAAALYEGRATNVIPTAMLLDAVHRGVITPTTDGAMLINEPNDNEAVEAIGMFANQHSQVSAQAMLEIDGIIAPITTGIEERLAEIAAFTNHAHVDRVWMQLAIGFTAFLAALSVVPTLASSSTSGVFGVAIALIGIAYGWWWLSSRSLTTPEGARLLNSWLKSASPNDRNLFDMAVNQTHLINQDGGPDTSAQRQLVRRLRGLGAH